MFSDTLRCLLYNNCPSLLPETDCIASSGTGCLSADADCDLCNAPGTCDANTVGVVFTGSRDECLQACKDNMVYEEKVGCLSVFNAALGV